MCEIDYCDGDNDTTLTLRTTEERIDIGLCLRHSVQLEKRLSEITGEEINLRSDRFGTIGEINEAIDYLDALAAVKHEKGN